MRLGSSSDHWQQVKSCFREKRLIFVAEKPDSANETPIVEDSQARLARLERLEKLGNTIPSPKPKPHEDYESMSNEQRLAILKNAVPKNSEAFAKKATPITRPKDEERRTAITKNQEEEKSKKETSGQAENTTALHYVHGIDAYTTIAQYDAKIALEKGFSVEDWFDQDGNLAVKLVENKGFATFLQSTIAPNTDRNIEDVQTAITEIIRGTDSGKNILQQLQIAILQAPQKGKEAVYSNFYGFKIEDAVTSYIGARGKFSDAGIAASSWFDKDGILIADKTQLQKLLPPILAFVPGGKYQNAEAFLQAINAENTDALRALQILQETIATRESMISKQMEVMSEAKKSDPNASLTTIIDNYSENYMDLFRYGTSYEKGLAAAGIAAGIYGIVKSKWVRYAVGSTIGLQLVEKVTGFNLLKKAGVLKDNMVIKGTASDAMYSNIKEQYSKKNSRNDLDSLEQKALDYDDEKTAAIIKLNNTPLKDLLNWHQAYYSALDDTERKNVLKQCPRQARFMVNSMSPEETAGLTMGVLSLYLKQSARNSAKTDPQVANRAIDSNFARKLVRAKYFGEQEDGNQIFTGVSDRYAHMEFRQKDKSATLDFNDFVDREVSTTDLARNFEEPHTVVDQVASAIITWGKTNLTLENVKQLARQIRLSVKEAGKLIEDTGAETIPKIETYIRETLKVPINQTTVEYVNGTVKVYYKKNGEPYVTEFINIANIAGGITWDVFTAPVDIGIIAGKTGYEAYKILKEKDLIGKIEGGADSALLWLQEQMGYGLEETDKKSLNEYLQSDKAYANTHLGQFANEYVGMNPGEFKKIELPPEQGGNAIYALERIDLETIAPPPASGRRLSESEWRLHIHEKLLEQAKTAIQTKLAEDDRYKEKGIVFDSNKDVVGAVFSNNEGASGFATIFVRIPLSKPLGPEQTANATEMKTFDWMLQQYLDKWYQDKIYIKNVLKGGEDEVIYEAKSTPDIREFLDRIESATGHEEELANVQNGVKQLIHNTEESRKQSYLKDPEQIRKSLKELITKNFDVKFAEDI